LPLNEAVDRSRPGILRSEGFKPAESALADFIYDRLAGSLREQGYTAQEVDAVVSQRPQRLGDIPKRLAAVRAFSALPEAAALAAANKRVGNILKKVEDSVEAWVDRAAQGAAEVALHEHWSTLCPKPMPPSSPATTPLAAGAGRTARPGRCLLRRRHGQCRRSRLARQPPRPAGQTARGDEPGRRPVQAVDLRKSA
jgi:hypothetical protein